MIFTVGSVREGVQRKVQEKQQAGGDQGHLVRKFVSKYNRHMEGSAVYEAVQSPERSALLLLFQHRRPTLDHQSPHVEGVASSNLAVSAQNRSVGEQ